MADNLGIGIFDEISAIREAYLLHPERAAELAGVTVRTWYRWCRSAREEGGIGAMPREVFVQWVRALEADWRARHPGSARGWRVDEAGRVRRVC